MRAPRGGRSDGKSLESDSVRASVSAPAESGADRAPPHSGGGSVVCALSLLPELSPLSDRVVMSEAGKSPPGAHYNQTGLVPGEWLGLASKLVARQNPGGGGVKMVKLLVSTRFPKLAVLLVAVSLMTLGAAPDAWAQGKAPAAAKADKKTREDARKAYSGGEKLYGDGKYDEAYESFKKANELIPSPHALYWMAMALDKQGKGEDAAAAFETLLANPNASKIGDEKLTESKDRLAALKGSAAPSTGELNVMTNPPGASVSVDGEAQPGETPMILKLAPGTHKISVSSPGYETEEADVDITSGKRAEKNLELRSSEGAPVAAPPPEPAETPAEPPPPAKPRSKVPAYVTLGIAGAGAVVGTIFGIKALGAKKDFNDDPTTDKADDVERNALIADMAFGVAITLGVTGVVLLTSSDSEPAKEGHKKSAPKRAKLHFAPYMSPHGGGAAAHLTF